MARFRAYTSDASDTSDTSDDDTRSQPETYVRRAPQPEDDESDSDQESASSSSSRMQEDDLVASPTREKNRTQNALVEDEDGEIHYAHEVNSEGRNRSIAVRVSPPSLTSASPPPRVRGDPTIMPWAQQIGVDAQKMHVMQTSLFRMPEEAAAIKAMNQPKRTQLRGLLRKHSRESDGDGLRFESIERASFAHDIIPSYRPSRKYARVESSASAVKGKEGLLIDAGLALGRSFRVGWGPGGTIVHSGSICGPFSSPRDSANSSIISKTAIPIFSTTEAVSQATGLSSKLLQHHLSNSPIEQDDDGVPFANPSPSLLHFSSFASLFPSTDRSYEASLFRLGQALFDTIDLRLGDSITVDIQNRISSLRRKTALSAWLENAVVPATEADLRSNTSASPIAVAFTLLTGNQVEKACEAAMDGGYLKLATVISQAGGDLDFREDLKEQMQLWKEQRIDAHIDESVRKVYALLAGVVGEVVEDSKGGGLEKCSDVDVLKGLDWKRAFGLHLWFSEPVDASIAEVFRAYTQLTSSEEPHQRGVAHPVPWYSERTLTVVSSRWKLPSVPSSPDALYSLVRLHAEPACSLSQILNPLSFGASPMDYALCWHLYIILSRCMRIRDFADRSDPGIGGRARVLGRLGEMDEDEEESDVEGHSPTADLLASSYASQLESAGMIQEALFVLLHIEGSAGRKKAVKDLLARSASKLDEWMTRGVVGSLKIPMAWVQEAKAMHALDNGDIWDAYELYLSAGDYDAAHDLAVLELAPDAIIRHDLELLKSIFDKFLGHSVDGWHIRGKAFLDYVRIMTRLPELQEEQEQDAVLDASHAMELDDLIRSVPKLIGILPDVLRNRLDARHNAALAEMTAGLVSKADKVRPLALAQIQPTLVDEATKLRHIHSTAYARFMKSISVN